MNDHAPSAKLVTVRSVPLDLAQFLKFSGVAESGGAAKQAIAGGQVAVNGAIEQRKGRKLVAGDKVTISGRTLIVHVA